MCLFDDLTNWPLPGSMQSMMEDENLRKAFQACISYGLEFAFHKKILLKNKTLKVWSQAGFGWLVYVMWLVPEVILVSQVLGLRLLFWIVSSNLG